MGEQNRLGYSKEVLQRIRERDRSEPHGPSPDTRSPEQIEFALAWADIQAHVPGPQRLDAQNALIAEFRRKYPDKQW